MRFTPTPLDGVFVIEMERLEDERGWFARTFCQGEFKAHGLNPCVAQCNSSFNKSAGTLRGMHYQAQPYGEAKLVRCIAGAIFDVALDVRPSSATFGRWYADELSASNAQMLYLPEGIAHGFLTLEDNTEIFYQMSTPYHPEATRGVRWDDPAWSIQWPIVRPLLISERDKSLPFWKGS